MSKRCMDDWQVSQALKLGDIIGLVGTRGMGEGRMIGGGRWALAGELGVVHG